MLRIIDITSPDINNGIGIRGTIWVAGCKHHCKGCHNAWTWKYDQGKVFEKHRAEIIEELESIFDQDHIVGLTLSGGDPLYQDDSALYELSTILEWFRYKYPNKTIWIYSGFTIEELLAKKNKHINKILQNTDVLIDGKFDIDKRDIAKCAFRGSTNQRIIDVKKYFAGEDFLITDYDEKQ